MQWSYLGQGVRQAKLLEPTVEHRRPPDNLVPGDEVLFHHEYRRSLISCQAVKLDNLHVLGNSWFQFRHGRIANNYRLDKNRTAKLADRVRDIAQLRHSVSSTKEALWVHDALSDNYFHWMTDVLPKLQAWLESGEACRNIFLSTLLAQKPFVQESLEMLGFRTTVYERLRLNASSLIVISSTAPTGNFRSDLLRRLQKTLLDSKADPSCAGHQKIYISRLDAKRRYLINEKQIIPILEKSGFHVVWLEGNTLQQQINLFRNARVVIGLHGAGLTNMLWMQPESQVIEIRTRGDAQNNCYYSMANALNHQYKYILADKCDDSLETYDSKLYLSSEKLLAGIC